MPKQIYPIILHPETGGGYSVNIPDLEIGTQGETIAECIDMARDAIGLWGICQQDEHRPIPKAVNFSPAHAANEILTLVDIDFDEYRKANDLRAVRKNVTIPAWLCHQAEESGVNFSQVLQTALKQQLNLENRS